MTDASASLQDLTAHVDWVRRLALRLVRDPEVAEDLAQEALVVALRQPAAAVEAPRGWFAGVLRNLMRDRERRDLRRRQREERVARDRDDADESTAALYQRMAAHREVVDALLTLPEHYRVVLVRRYYDDQSPRSIAEQLGMPVATVKTRLARGLRQLRGRLDETHGGDGKRWALALAPLLKVGLGGRIALATRRLMTPRGAVLAGAGAVVLASASLWPWITGAGHAEPGARAPNGALAAASGAVVTPPAARARKTATAGLRRAAPVVQVAGVGPLDLNAPQRPVPGKVWWSDGTPAAGTVLRYDRMPAASTTGTVVAVAGADGAFEFRDLAGVGTVRALQDDRVTVLAGVVRSGGGSSEAASRQDVQVVLARRRSLRGTVRDASGAPLCGQVRVDLRLPRGFAQRFGSSLEGTALADLSVQVDLATGSFEMPDLPDLRAAQLVVRADSYRPAPARLLGELGASIEITLDRYAPGPGMVSGRVVDAVGDPVAGVRVGDGRVGVATDPHGDFCLPMETPGRLLVALEGRAPVRESIRSGQRDVLVRLPGPPRRVRGRVLDADGAAAAGLVVYVADPDVLAVPSDHADDAASDAAGRRIETHLSSTPGLAELPMPEVAENLAAGLPRTTWRRTATDSAGEFALDGLGYRAYSIAVFDPATLQTVYAPVDAAATRVTLRSPSREGAAQLRGRLVDSRGIAIAGARVQAMRPVFALRRGEDDVLRHLRFTSATRSDAQGRFVLQSCGGDGLELRVTGGGLFDLALPVESTRDLPSLELRVARKVRLRVTCDRSDAGELRAFDADGQAVAFEWRNGPQRVQDVRAPLHGGKSRVLTLPDTAREVAAFAGGEELARAPLGVPGAGTLQLRL